MKCQVLLSGKSKLPSAAIVVVTLRVNSNVFGLRRSPSFTAIVKHRSNTIYEVRLKAQS